MIVERVEKHLIKHTHQYYKLLKSFCWQSKNLYNHANYLIRQRFIAEGLWLRYSELDKLLKTDMEYPDYRNMPTAQSAQQTLRLLDKNWKAFFTALKDYKQHPDKYYSRPKSPQYKRKNGLFTLILTNQECKLRDGLIRFPKTFKGFTVQTNTQSFQQIRIIPRLSELVVEVVYKTDVSERLPDNQRYAGIDLGVSNLATIVSNIHSPYIINGKPIKSMNQYYNKRLAHLKSKAVANGVYTTKRIQHLTAKRNRKIDDYLHKASKIVVQSCFTADIHTIVLGKNKDWKQSTPMSKRVNQHFVGIPFNRLIQMIEYKAEQLGVAIVTTEESYTSGTSFLDGELPIKQFYNKKRRIHRGLFKSNTGVLINADVNGAYQILRKVFPKVVVTDGIEGVGFHPVLVTASQTYSKRMSLLKILPNQDSL